jgi:hypothetical protein
LVEIGRFLFWPQAKHSAPSETGCNSVFEDPGSGLRQVQPTGQTRTQNPGKSRIIFKARSITGRNQVSENRPILCYTAKKCPGKKQ